MVTLRLKLRDKLLLTIVPTMVAVSTLLSLLWYFDSVDRIIDNGTREANFQLTNYTDKLEQNLSPIVGYLQLIGLDVNNGLENLTEISPKASMEYIYLDRAYNDFTALASYAYVYDTTIWDLEKKVYVGADNKELIYADAIGWEPSLGADMVLIAPHSNLTTPSTALTAEFVTATPENSKANVFSLMQPIVSKGALLGTVNISVICTIFSDFDYQLLQFENSKFFIRSGDTVIYSGDRDLSYVDDTAFLNSLDDYENNDIITYDEERYILCSEYLDDFNWQVVSLVPYDQLVNQANTHFFNLIITSLILVALVALFIVVMTNHYTKSLQHVVRDMQNLSTKHREHYKTNDEISMLYNSYVDSLDRIDTLLEETINIEREKREVELNVLNNQITPHFLHNTIYTIQCLAENQKATNIVKMTAALSNILYIYMKKEVVFISLEQELSLVQNFYELHAFRYNYKIDYNLMMDDNLKDLLIPKLTIQPFVENAIKHGCAPLDRFTNIIVQISTQGEQLQIVIRDDGVGMCEELIQKLDSINASSGIGIKNTIERISAYFGDKASVMVDSVKNSFTRVEIKLPLITEENVDNYR